MRPTVFWSLYLIIPANVPPVLELFLGLLTSIFISSMELSSGQKHLTFLSKQNLHAQFSQWTSLHLSYTDIQLICGSSHSWTAFRNIKIISWPCPWVLFSSYCMCVWDQQKSLVPNKNSTRCPLCLKQCKFKILTVGFCPRPEHRVPATFDFSHHLYIQNTRMEVAQKMYLYFWCLVACGAVLQSLGLFIGQLTTWLNVSHCNQSKSLTFYIITFHLPCYLYYSIIISVFSLSEVQSKVLLRSNIFRLKLQCSEIWHLFFQIFSLFITYTNKSGSTTNWTNYAQMAA